ncbi:MAG: transglutaminase-like cysteine peptidase [Rhodobiaceae bacterium]|nr:transglutaminase-like cysteine peptidase [Rhodobiaceae bacterium]
MIRVFLAAGLLVLGLGAAEGDVGAPARATVDAASRLPLSLAMATGSVTSAPYAYKALCRTTPSACTGGGVDRMVLNDDNLALLDTVNRKFNASIQSLEDMANHGLPDVWSVGGKYGDCEDFALAKRQALIDAGVPASALSMAVVRTAEGVGHAVLVVRTDRGDFVLDNRRAEILGWDHTEYRWYKITAPDDPRRWVTVSGSRFV